MSSFIRCASALTLAVLAVAILDSARSAAPPVKADPTPPPTAKAVVQVGVRESLREGAYFSVALSPDAKRLVSGYYSSTIRQRDSATGKEVNQFSPNTGPVFSVTYSPCGKFLASGGHDGIVRLWSLATHKQLFEKTDHRTEVQSTVYSLAFSPDGKMLASGAMDRVIRLFEIPSGKSLGQLTGHDYYIMGLSFSSDGKRLASASWDGKVGVWDVKSGKQLHRLDEHRAGVRSVCYSPNDNILVSASADKTIRFWCPVTGRQIGTPIIQDDEVMSLVMSPDGRFFASGGRDGVLRLWELSTRREVLRHEPESGPSTSLSYARTGTRLASVESQGLAHVWDPTGSPDLARQMARLKPEVLWAELIGNDPVRAHQAFWLLAKTPDDTLKLARKYPIPAPVDQKAVKRWISQLDDESFEVRQTATAELEKEGQRAEPYLRRALEGRPQLEARRRIERLLGKLPDWPYTTERVRTARVLALLERLGTRGAREVLEQRAKSDPDSWSSKEAKSALDRLNNSPRK